MSNCCLQGYLYKKSTKPLNKEWKKKYVALSDNGKIIYHPSLHVSVRTCVTLSVHKTAGLQRLPKKEFMLALKVTKYLREEF